MYKVFNIPITHDETATTVHYSKYSVWQIMMYPDEWPNNHILNTIFTKGLIYLFGEEQWAVRSPNLLFFPVFCIGIYRIMVTLFSKTSIFIPAATTIFFANAYLLDFFGLCRGYGIAIGLSTIATSFLITGYLQQKTRHVWLAFFLALLASYANFTFLNYWISVAILTGAYFLIKDLDQIRKVLIPFTIIFLLSVGYLALIFKPLYKMTSTDQFKYWGSNGFFQDTIISLIENWRNNAQLPFGVNDVFLASSATGIVIFGIILLANKIRKSNIKKVLFQCPLAIAICLLGMITVISIIQKEFLNTPYYTGRTALFYYPSFSLLLLTLLVELENLSWKNLNNILSLIIPILMIFHLANTYKLCNVREWWYDESTFEVLDILEEYRGSQEQISLNVNWHFHRSFFFYTETGKVPWLVLFPYDKNIDADSEASFYYVFESDLELLDTRFTRVRRFGWDRWLVKKISSAE